MQASLPEALLAELRERATRDVAAGFDTDEDIADSLALWAIDELGHERAQPQPGGPPPSAAGALSEEETDALIESARRATAAAVEAHQLAQAGWPIPTDCDRLDRAFRALSSAGICARQHFTCCQTCGHGEIGDELAPGDRGYVFYHWQDTEAAVDGAGLYLAYGALADGNDAAEAIGREIVAAVAREGLVIEWDGSVNTRIHVQLDWKRRRRASGDRTNS